MQKKIISNLKLFIHFLLNFWHYLRHLLSSATILQRAYEFISCNTCIVTISFGQSRNFCHGWSVICCLLKKKIWIVKMHFHHWPLIDDSHISVPEQFSYLGIAWQRSFFCPLSFVHELLSQLKHTRTHKCKTLPNIYSILEKIMYFTNGCVCSRGIFIEI